MADDNNPKIQAIRARLAAESEPAPVPPKPAKRRKGELVRLSDIKTKADQRWRRRIKAEITEIGKMTDDYDFNAYVIVCWDTNGETFAYWNTDKLGHQGVIGPIRAELAKRAVERREAILDAQGAIVVMDEE